MPKGQDLEWFGACLLRFTICEQSGHKQEFMGLAAQG